MLGGVKKTPGTKTGFTIVEVMIFLAVSGLTFLIAAYYINGKQTQAEFSQGMDSATATIKSLIDDVQDNNYDFPSLQDVECGLANGNKGMPKIGTSPTPVQYPNPGCTISGVFLAPETAAGATSYSVIPVAGCQYYSSQSSTCTNDIGDGPPTDLAEESLTPLKDSMTLSNTWPGGIQVSKLYQVDSDGAITQNDNGLIGILGELPQSGNIGQSGAQRTALAYVPSTALGNSLADYDSAIISPGAKYILDTHFVICFSGPSGQAASITVGGQYGGLSVKLGMGQEAYAQC